MLALEFADIDDYHRVEQGDILVLDGLRHALGSGGTEITVRNVSRDQLYSTQHRLSDRQIAMLLAGGLIPWLRRRKGSRRPEPLASREAR
nr:hypothetical protein [Microbispora camponoti]